MEADASRSHTGAGANFPMDHPCFNPRARHTTARMHLPVAPKCNIQCGFCNRLYDCTNESRPGVTSQVVTPEECVPLVGKVLERLPRLKVLGIAGPGDPLANPETTLRTIDLMRQHYPNLTLCISANGLALPEMIAELTQREVKFVTITINAIDPEIGARIYPWIRLKGRIVRGKAAAEHLLACQQEGLRELVRRGVNVKINTVYISGVNNHHIIDIARFIADAGAVLHNIVPLIPVAGTEFANWPAPDLEEMRAVRKACAQYLPIMGHCRQCRADAIGFLGEDIPLSCFVSPAAIDEEES